MDTCRSCERKDRKIRAQGIVAASQQEQLEEARARVRRLEEALREICDYAEVCHHSPARPLLAVKQ